ncbi:MAG: hypothetical protein F6K56_20460, partial [Moorea sp. SIO3G5]|nr:hypothetical protein [Moorena sp. SIO3G5]
MAKKSRKTASQYSEGKSKVGISLTPTGIGLLTQMAQNTGLSRSELIERIARGNIAIACQEAKMTITLENPPEAKETSPNNGATKSQTKIQVIEGEQPLQADVSEPGGSGVSQEDYQSLQQKAQQQANLIEDLQQKLAQQKSETAEQTQSYQSLQQQAQEQGNLVKKLQKQLADQKSETAEQTQSYQSLQQQAQEQGNLVKKLQKQLADQKSETAE